MEIDFISRNATKHLKTKDKIQLILKMVKRGVMIVLEEGLSPEEQIELLKETMKEIDPLRFIGIDIISFNGSFMQKSIGKITSLTIIAPGGKVEIIKNHQTNSLYNFCKVIVF
ncbi:MAG: DUF2073 domain-containing protein [Candidatus Odinarchaeota archaeon]|nr:DUF2073 domain-containing protein [Candidatus Odinarchaeota archaeon]